ncbi:hypothetical protein [Actinomadura rubrisoli]|uniref:Uncharacterized protein n=1 Tax=Actinomadura rubrisoli TaxID=2530368 RepID=A0A4R5BRS5_9ACTN|nr:hypothetical protein [Actinomadura rubrisoli]TDD88715.1 hypothetical protein E1298_14890 [Actinomadura rubrisoli]
MDQDEIVSRGPEGRGPSRDVAGVLMLVNGVVAAIGGAYVTTGSLAVTVLAGAAALVLAVLVVRKR